MAKRYQSNQIKMGRPVRHVFNNNKKVATRSDNFDKTLVNEAIAESVRLKELS